MMREAPDSEAARFSLCYVNTAAQHFVAILNFREEFFINSSPPPSLPAKHSHGSGETHHSPEYQHRQRDPDR